MERELFTTPGQSQAEIVRSGRLLETASGEIVGRFGGSDYSVSRRPGTVRREANGTRLDPTGVIRAWPDNGFYRYFQTL